MGSFFTRIFLWFWLSLGLLVAAFIIVGIATRPERSYFAPQGRPGPFGLFADLSLEAWRRGGPDSLARFEERLHDQTGLRTHLVGEGDRDLLGRRLTPEQARLAAGARGFDRPKFRPSFGGERVAHPLADETGRRYAFLTEPGPRRGPPRLPRGLQVWFLVSAVAITGGVCYGLARTFAAPVLRLRQATRRLAGGDLSARVSPALGRRHDELGDLGHDFDLMAERLETTLTLHRRLVRDVSHELRSPLARVSVALGLARQAESPESRSAHERIEREVERLNELIGQILTLSRLEGGDLPRDHADVDLEALVREIAADVHYEASIGGRSVAVIAAEPATVRGNPPLLRSAIENVVRNAARHTREGTTVEIRIDRCEESAVGDTDTGGHGSVRITVRDHGPGVPPETLSEIFRPFYRVEESRERASGGAGLGLAISQAAVGAHGGRLLARNDPEDGLVVEIIFPAA